MLRRQFLGLSAASVLAASAFGCRNKQFARVVKPGEDQMVGSHAAGAETYKPLIDESVSKLLGNCSHGVQPAGYDGSIPPGERRICFISVENKTAEEIGDFKEQIYQLIDSRISEARGTFTLINRRAVDAALRDTRLRPDDLLTQQKMRIFSAHLEQEGQPFDYMLWAVLTSGTTRENKDYQRDYLLTLELVDVQTMQQFKESATLSKGYHQTRASRLTASNPFKWK
jgi:hypothetical protein